MQLGSGRAGILTQICLTANPTEGLRNSGSHNSGAYSCHCLFIDKRLCLTLLPALCIYVVI